MGAVILGILRTIAWGYYFSPQCVRRAAAHGLGFVLRKAGVRSAVVRDNLALAFPEPEIRERLFHEAYEHLGFLVFEILMLLGPMPRFVRNSTVLRGVEHWEAAKKAGKGVIILSSHTGNWEVMGAAGAYWGGIDSMIVTKHLKPEWLHEAIEKGRLRCGVRATYEPRTMKDILKQLKANRTIGFVLDQYAGPPVGVRVPFMGVVVSTSLAVAALAKRTGAVIVPAVNYRDSSGRIISEIRPPAPWLHHEDSSYELAANTAALVAQLEADIRRYPGQWLWIHRRFKGDLSPLREGEWLDGRVRGDRPVPNTT